MLLVNYGIFEKNVIDFTGGLSQKGWPIFDFKIIVIDSLSTREVYTIVDAYVAFNELITYLSYNEYFKLQ